MDPCTFGYLQFPQKLFSLAQIQALWAKLQALTPSNSDEGTQGPFVISRRQISGLVCLLVVALGSQAFALKRTSRYAHKHTRVRHLRWNPMFRGSHEMLVKQNEAIDTLELPRIANDDELDEVIGNDDLVPLRDSRSLRIAANLTENRRYCKPWTRDFVQDFSAAFYEEFHKPIQVNSAVRTVDQQKRLRRHNRNAGPIEGETASTHLTGITLDISKRGLTKKEHAWIEQYFLPLKTAGLIDPIEERRQPVFHVVVFDRYTEWRDSRQFVNAETDATD